jgi:hypothetical protein
MTKIDKRDRTHSSGMAGLRVIDTHGLFDHFRIAETPSNP